MTKAWFNSKAVILALGVTTVFIFFLGSLAHAPLTMDQSFSGKYWYYINRGYPTAWAGVSLENSRVDLPHFRLPLLQADDGHGTKLVKIVDLRIFLPLFATLFLLSYIPSFIMAKAVDENRRLFPFFVILIIVTLSIGLINYFLLFSNI